MSKNSVFGLPRILPISLETSCVFMSSLIKNKKCRNKKFIKKNIIKK